MRCSSSTRTADESCFSVVRRLFLSRSSFPWHSDRISMVKDTADNDRSKCQIQYQEFCVIDRPTWTTVLCCGRCNLKRTRNICTTIIIALKEVCPPGWLVCSPHNVDYASLFAMEHGKLHVLVNLTCELFGWKSKILLCSWLVDYYPRYAMLYVK